MTHNPINSVHLARSDAIECSVSSGSTLFAIQTVDQIVVQILGEIRLGENYNIFCLAWSPTISIQVKISADILKHFSYFSEKIRAGISSKLSPKDLQFA